MATPTPGAAVSVLEFGRWLDGVVVETNEASGEFLVEYDDEAEVAAWVSLSQPWRTLSLDATPAEPSTAADEEPALPPDLLPLPPPPPPLPPPPDAPPPPPPPATTDHPPQREEESEELSSIIVDQFALLYEATACSDGCGAETASVTRARFGQLHQQVLLA